MKKKEPDHKKKFQLDRLILFSDAVFAIAITLMVIELKIPQVEGPVTDAAIGEKLLHMIPEFNGFIFSFFIIGIYWTGHHRLFGRLTDYDHKLLWINLLFLFSVVIMPFTSGLYGEYYQPDLMLPNIIYAVNIFLTGIVNAWLIRHIHNPKKELTDTVEEKHIMKQMYARSYMMPILLLIGLIISYLTIPWIGRIAPLLVPLYLRIIRKIFKPRSVLDKPNSETVVTA